MTDPPILTPHQVLQLLNHLSATDRTPAKQKLGTRNRLILLLMLDAGLRSNEVRQLTINDLYWNGTPKLTLDLPPTIAKYHVGGKIPLSPRLQQALADYRLAYGLEPPAWPSPLAICNPHNAQPLTTRQLRRIVNQAGRAALDRHIWCHLMRHTFGDNLRDCADIGTRMRLMRHKDVRSTMIYDHPTERDKETAIATMHARHTEPTP